jgi:hypothetical protein
MAKSKRKNKKKTAAIRYGDFATPERKQHFGEIKTEVVYGPNGMALFKRDRAMITCQLDMWKRREKMSDSLFDAAWIYRAAFLFHVFGIKTDDHASSGRADEISKLNAKIHSERLLAEAHKVLSPAQAAAVRAICGMDEPAKTSDRFELLLRGLVVLAKLWRTDKGSN